MGSVPPAYPGRLLTASAAATELPRLRRWSRRPLADELGTETERLVAGGLASPARATPEDIAVGEKFDQVVDAALAALPLKHRQVVVLVAVNGPSHAEAAKLPGARRGQ